MKCNADILFNKHCMTENIVPAYATLKIPRTSLGATITQRKAQTLRIKEKIKFLYHKKEYLNRELYNTHPQATNEWGPVWDLISSEILRQVQEMAAAKHATINTRLRN
jgi:hypothetical protein